MTWIQTSDSSELSSHPRRKSPLTTFLAIPRLIESNREETASAWSCIESQMAPTSLAWYFSFAFRISGSWIHVSAHSHPHAEFCDTHEPHPMSRIRGELQGFRTDSRQLPQIDHASSGGISLNLVWLRRGRYPSCRFHYFVYLYSGSDANEGR